MSDRRQDDRRERGERLRQRPADGQVVDLLHRRLETEAAVADRGVVAAVVARGDVEGLDHVVGGQIRPVVELQTALELDRPHLAVVRDLRKALRQVRLRRQRRVVRVDRVIDEPIASAVGTLSAALERPPDTSPSMTIVSVCSAAGGADEAGAVVGPAGDASRGGRGRLGSAARRDDDRAAGQQAEEAFVHQLSSRNG